MAHFYGLIQGQSGDATRMGSSRSGYRAWAQNSTGRVSVVLDHNLHNERDYAEITIDGSTQNYGAGTALRLGALDLSALVNHSDDPTVRRHVERARKALEAASDRAQKLSKVKVSA